MTTTMMIQMLRGKMVTMIHSLMGWMAGGRFSDRVLSS